MLFIWLALLKLFKPLFVVLAAAVLLIEEWGWKPLTAAAAWVARWPPLALLEAHIRRAPPRVALCLFIVPAVLLFPIKLLALWLIHRHHPLMGIGIIIAAKIAGTALVGRLFIICEPQLMTFPWFALALTWWRSTKERVKHIITSSAAWRAAGRMKRWARSSMQRWWRHWRRYDR